MATPAQDRAAPRAPRRPLARRFLRPLTFALCGTMVLTAGPATARDESLRPEAFAAGMENLEGLVERLARQYANPVAMLRAHPLERRLIDGRIFFELGNYETASIVLSDLVETPAFKTNADYYRAALWLSQSLLELKNLRGAQRYLELVAACPDPELADEARYNLIDMALAGTDDGALRRATERITSASSDRTRYALGKALLRLKDFRRAAEMLSSIGSHSEYYLRARYYVGVTHTAEKHYDLALAEFDSLLGMAQQDETQRAVADLARMASARLRLETGQAPQAVTQYQLIHRRSPLYNEALYEMAWTYVDSERYDKALQTIDVLLLTVTDPRLDVEAHVLQGRLNINMQDYEAATASYEAIVERFAPIRNELERFIHSPENIQRYFDWLLDRRSDGAKLTAPLTERTAAWVESTQEMGRVAGVFDLLAAERSEVRATDELARDLDQIVGSKNRVELFPELRDGWTRALAAENQLLALSTEMLDAQHTETRRTVALAGERLDALEEMVLWRHRLEERLRDMPMSYSQYKTRKARVDERFIDLRRKSFLVGQNLKEVERQLLAVERYVNDLQFSDNAQKMTPEREQLMRTEILAEKERMQSLLGEMKQLQKAIDLEAARVGTGDAVTEGEGDLKSALIQAHKREGMYYDELAMQARTNSPTATADAAAFGRFRERIWTAVDRLGGVIRAIDDNVGSQVAQLKGLIRHEHAQLDGYDRDLGRYENESSNIAMALGGELFERARHRMDDVVLEADVGLIDVAWQRKRERTDEIQRLNVQRSTKLRKLDDELEHMKSPTAAQPVAPDDEEEP